MGCRIVNWTAGAPDLFVGEDQPGALGSGPAGELQAPEQELKGLKLRTC